MPSVDVSGLVGTLDGLLSYRELRQELREGEYPSSLGLLRAARPCVTAALVRDLKVPVLVVAATAESANEFCQSLRDWYPPPVSILPFPEPSSLFYDRSPWSADVVGGRLRVISALHEWSLTPGSGQLVVVASARSLMQRTLPRRQFRVSVTEIKVGDIVDLDRVLHRLSGVGYDPVTVVQAPGQFSHRGGILDVFSTADDLPARVELFGSQVESIRRFDPTTQRSQDRVESVTVLPAREALPRHGPRVVGRVGGSLSSDLTPDVRAELERHHTHLADGVPFDGIEYYLPLFYSEPATLLDYLPSPAVVITDDIEELEQEWARLEQQALNRRAEALEEGALAPNLPIPYVTWGEWVELLTDRPVLNLGHGGGDGSSRLAEAFSPLSHFGGQLKRAMRHVGSALQDGSQVVVTSVQAERLAQLWGEDHEYHLTVGGLAERSDSPLLFVHGGLSKGWVLSGLDPGGPFSSLVLLTDNELFGWKRPERRRLVRRRRLAPEVDFVDLLPGDYVVHVDYGVGVFRGLVKRAMDEAVREYLLVEYDGPDRLYVPVDQADRLDRYIGVDDRSPRLNRLGTAEWAAVKERARRGAEKVARELLELQAAREVAVGHAFSADTAWQSELEASFPYYETEDQLRAIADVKADMEKPKPMDRLICGDVGFGKTEVALRAAFKAVTDGKQVAVLVPTTVLAQQHFLTFRRRLTPFPIEVDVLSRFRSTEGQQQLLQRLRAGLTDIVVGTHRLLQKDVAFSNLGLAIIDEEQRFGVTHKERLKQIRTEVDVLTLTATPIPRTLYLSLAGLRDISVIETPPEERLPITSFVGELDWEIVQKAIRKELKRGGQVFYVHNRVHSIASVRDRLQRLVPEASFSVAHGQMREADLERVMADFVEGRVDVLVCTSIIENGLDIPNANTLMVERADAFGVAQLYQLRGRVGRSAQRAHAYFFHGRPEQLTAEARLRLETIKEIAGLGSGYGIAMRDLEIRGAGDILGTRQSGHIAEVGFEYYMRLLARQVQELKAERSGETLPPEALESVQINLPIAVGLPEHYVADKRLRLQIYRRFAALRDLTAIGELENELLDRFGPIPVLARNLLHLLRIKVQALKGDISGVALRDGRVLLRVREGTRPDPIRLKQVFGNQVAVARREIWLPEGWPWHDRLLPALTAMTSNGTD
jgi:transcription-repair coupling factor (superfamily II helicase)